MKNDARPGELTPNSRSRRRDRSKHASRQRRFPLQAVGSRIFYAYMPQHRYIFAPTRELWPSSSVNARIPPVDVGAENPIPASVWLDHHQPVEQLTWYPGEPMLIRDKLIAEGGFIDAAGRDDLQPLPAARLPARRSRHRPIPGSTMSARSIPTTPSTSSAGWRTASRGRPRRSTTPCCLAARRASARTRCCIR